jgi:hypothetical protein
MSRYSRFQQPTKKAPGEVHPVWRGIGCVMMVVIPVLSYAGAVKIVEYGLQNHWPFPYTLIGHIYFPPWVWRAPVLPLLATPIANYDNLGAVALIFLALVIALAGVFSTVYAIIYRVIAPPRYSAVDAPPPKYKAKSYKR